MLIYKFGGTSVGSPVRMKKVAGLVTEDNKPKIVVLSAVSGTTNKLIELSQFAVSRDTSKVRERINSMQEEYFTFIDGLLTDEVLIKEARVQIGKLLEEIGGHASKGGERTEKEIAAYGELMSTFLFSLYLKETNISSALLPALEFMTIDENEEPEIEKIGERLSVILQNTPDKHIYVTQGYICRDHLGQVDNLKRGGSDYTASLLGAAIRSEEVQIWTDIDGMHNNDPRIVKNTFPISELTFDEAAELAYFGAKILHPSSILPAQKYNIPVRLKSTLDEKAPGTLIANSSERGKVKAIAAKDGITAIKIKSSRMLLAYGFLRKVFEIFERHRTSIDMITTSEVAVSLSIDDDSRLPAIREELQRLGYVEIDSNQTIICIVGNMITEDKGVLERIFSATQRIPIRMISYGGSRFNISLLIDTQYKQEALVELNEKLFRF